LLLFSGNNKEMGFIKVTVSDFTLKN